MSSLKDRAKCLESRLPPKLNLFEMEQMPIPALYRYVLEVSDHIFGNGINFDVGRTDYLKSDNTCCIVGAVLLYNGLSRMDSNGADWDNARHLHYLCYHDIFQVPNYVRGQDERDYPKFREALLETIARYEDGRLL